MERRKFAGFTGTGFAQPMGAPRSGKSSVDGIDVGDGVQGEPAEPLPCRPRAATRTTWKNSWNVRESRER